MAGAPAVTRSALARRIDAWERLTRLDKPIGILLLLWPTLTALWIAARGAPPLSLVIVFALGTVLMRSAGCAMNDWADRRYDAHVARTRGRPLVAGDLSGGEALAVGAVLALAAFGLTLFTNRATMALAVAALAIAIAYPFFKRFFALPQAFLGIAFSFGIPMAYAATRGEVEWPGWPMLAINLLWVVAYVTEYAMVDRDDDLKIGIKTSAITLGRADVAAIMAFYGLFLASWALLGRQAGLGAAFLAGIALAGAQALWHFTLIRDRSRDGCFRAFRENHWLGATVFAGIVLDYALR